MRLRLGLKHLRQLLTGAVTWPQVTVAPVITGSLNAGSTLTVTPGTYTNSPTSRHYQWYEAGAAVGTDATTYVSTIVGASIYCVETAVNAFGSTSSASASVGPITGSGLAAPTLALFSTSNTVPVVFTVSDTDYTAGLYGQIQIASDSGFSTILQDKVKLLDGDDWARLTSNFGFVDPSGTYYARFRMLRDNESGSTTVTDQLNNTFNADASAWSNTVTDTISVSVAVWSSTTGNDKSQYLTASNGNLTLTMNNSVNSDCGCRATVAATGKRYFETTVVSHGTEANGSLIIGVTNNALALGAAVFPAPGNGTNAGARWSVKAGSTTTNVARNGSAVTGTALSAACANGDKFGISFDDTANTVKLSHCPIGTGVWNDVQTITLTSNIPAAGTWTAYSGGFGRTGAGAPYDAWTTNFGGSAFSRTLDAGYSMYG